MKTIHRPKSRNRVWISFWIAFPIILLAIFIKYGGSYVVLPFVKTAGFFQGMGVAAVGTFTSKGALEVENRELKDQLALVEVDLDRNKLLAQENLELKELLGRFSKNSTVLTTVLAKPPMSLYDTLVVDVGSNNNVTVGDRVLALGVVPVGLINKVYPQTSVVQLFSSSGQKISVIVAGKIQTVAEAQGGGNFIIKLPKGSLVEKGDIVSSPNIKAEVFGRIENIETNENDPFIYARFSLPVNMSQLRFLQVDRSSVQ
jgi:cell shape-determining protein MreC